MEEDGRARFEKVFVNEGHDGDVVLGTSGGRDNSVVIINEFFKVANAHGTASHVIYTSSLIGIAIDLFGFVGALWRLCLHCFGLPQSLLILNVLFFEEEMIMHPLHAKIS